MTRPHYWTARPLVGRMTAAEAWEVKTRLPNLEGGWGGGKAQAPV